MSEFATTSELNAFAAIGVEVGAILYLAGYGMDVGDAPPGFRVTQGDFGQDGLLYTRTFGFIQVIVEGQTVLQPVLTVTTNGSPETFAMVGGDVWHYPPGSVVPATNSSNANAVAFLGGLQRLSGLMRDLPGSCSVNDTPLPLLRMAS